MPNILRPKRSSTAGLVPTTSNLTSGELGVNMADRRIYINNGTAVVQVGAGLLSALGDVALSGLTSGQSISWNGTAWVNSSAGSGTVTSVALSGGTTGLTTSGGPITTTGTITLAGTLAVANGGTGATDAATARTNLGLAIGSNVQAYDADLAAIAALSGTSGLLRKTAADTWSLDTNSYLTGNQSISLSGDATGSGATSIAVTLANSGVTAGTYTKVTVDAKGRVTVGASLASADLPTYTGTITSAQVTTALGFTPYNATNPSGYTSNTGTVTSVGGTGTVSGLSLSGTVTTSGNLTLGGTLAVTPSNFASQTANTILAAPNGAAGVPTFRALVAADIPTLNQNTTGTAANVTGTVAIANGGTGATTAAAARTNLGATTLGSNLFTLANVAAISFPRINADNTVSALDAASFRTAIGAGTSSTTGTVTSVGGTGTVSGLTLSGTVTGSGNLTLGGTLSLTSGNVTTALGFTPYNATNPSGYIDTNGTARTIIENNGTVIGTRRALNFIPGTGISLSIADDAANEEVDITITSTVTGGVTTFNTRSGAVTLTSGDVTGALGFTPYNSTNPSGYITSSGSISGNAATATNASQLNGITAVQLFNNMGQAHSARTAFDASVPSYDFGWRFIQGNGNSPSVNSAAQYYSLYIGLGSDYAATGSGSYGMQLAIPRGVTAPYLAIRYNEANSLGAWQRISAGYADNAGNTSSISNALAGGYTWTGRQYFRSNGNTAALAGDTITVQAYSDNAGGAIMAFHRAGQYAINMGLDSDNVFRIGGWSASANRLQMDMSGNLTMAGNVTAFSDERLKKDWAALAPGFVERLAAVKSGTYTRIDSGERQAGSSAQDWQALLPEVVMASTDENQTLSLAYGNAALVSAIELAKRVIHLEARLKELELKAA